MSYAAVVLVFSGVVCLAVSAVLLYHMIPRKGREAPVVPESDFRETGFALSQFILMIAGVALLIKGLA